MDQHNGFNAIESDRGNPLTAELEDDGLCPSCERPCPLEKRVAGVCPRCKSNLRSQHVKILAPDYREEPVKIEPTHKEVGYYEDGQRVQVHSDEEPIAGPSGHADASELEKYDTMMRAALRIILCGGDSKAIAHLLQCFFFVRGWQDDLGGIKTHAQLAKKLKVTKALVNKYVRLFSDVIPSEMNTVPRQPGERTEASRQVFTDKRYSFCTKTT